MNNKYFLAISLAAAILMVGCVKEDIDITTSVQSETTTTTTTPEVGTTLYATFSAAPASDSKVSFTESGIAGESDYDIDLAWQIEDSFSVYYKDGGKVADFTLRGDIGSTATFVSTTLLDAGDYTAVYPASKAATAAEAITSSNGSTITKTAGSIAYLNELCVMSADFSYNEVDVIKIEFEHHKAMLTINTSLGGVDFTSVTVLDGDKSYTVKLGDESGSSLSHLNFMVDENSGSRTLQVNFYYLTTLVGSSNVTFDVDFEAGSLYYYDAASDVPVDLVWDGTLDTDLAGSGTSTDPYLITTPAELAGLQSVDVSVTSLRYYKFESNGSAFDLNKNAWTPIPSGFYCNIDGNGILIKNLSVSSSEGNVGLFSSVKGGSTLSDITMTNATVETTCTTGNKGAAVLLGNGTASSWVIDCVVTNSSVKNVGTGTAQYCAAVVGYSKWSAVNLINCHSENCIIDASTNSNCTAAGVLAVQGTGWLIGCSSTNNTISGATCGGVLGAIGEHGNAQSGALMNVVGCYTVGGSIGIDGSSGSHGGVVATSFASLYGCYTVDAVVLGSKASSLVGRMTEAKRDDWDPTQVIYLCDMVHGSYTTLSTTAVTSTAQVHWYYASGGSTLTGPDWNAVPTQSNIEYNGNYSKGVDDVNGTAINVSSIGDTELADMNYAIEYAFTNASSKHSKISGAKFVKAPQGNAAPYLLEIEYK